MQESSDTLGGTMAVDSLAEVTVEPIVAPGISLFEGHELQVNEPLLEMDRTQMGNGFGFMILVLCSIVIIYLQRRSDGLFRAVFKASFDWNLALQDARVENSQRTRNFMLLQMTAIISIALFLSLVFIRLEPSAPPVSIVFMVFLLILLGLLFIKRIILWFLSGVFSLSNEFRIHRFNTGILMTSAGLSTLPLSLVILFSPYIPFSWIMYFGLAIGCLFYLKGIQRDFLLAMNTSSVSTLHLFYYFCALEILPAFVLIRYAQSM
jgi:hypothetical protein